VRQSKVALFCCRSTPYDLPLGRRFALQCHCRLCGVIWHQAAQWSPRGGARDSLPPTLACREFVAGARVPAASCACLAARTRLRDCLTWPAGAPAPCSARCASRRALDLAELLTPTPSLLALRPTRPTPSSSFCGCTTLQQRAPRPSSGCSATLLSRPSTQRQPRPSCAFESRPLAACALCAPCCCLARRTGLLRRPRHERR
jgi:hypothetical protein